VAEFYENGKAVRYDDTTYLGKGGEAEVFMLKDGRVLKRFKPPSHPDNAMDADMQKAAADRLAAHQHKLPALMTIASKFPKSVIMPDSIATDRAGKVIGYVMPFVSGGEVFWSLAQKSYRTKLSPDIWLGLLRDLHSVVTGVHAVPSAVIGDFNDLNVLALNGKAVLVDADSMQFGKYNCATFTTTFVDPLCCDPTRTAPVLVKPHNQDSDWYAYAVMLMRTLCFVGPYDGIYRAPTPATRCIEGKRPLARITVFQPEVMYPKFAMPYGYLPDDLLHHFQQVFQHDLRGAFPAKLINNMRMTKCACGVEHGRSMCPACSTTAPGAVKTVTNVRGNVTATRIFPSGSEGTVRILRAEVQGGHLLWLYQTANGDLKRESGVTVGNMAVDPSLRFWLRAGSTFIGQREKVVQLSATAGVAPSVTSADSTAANPVFGINEHDSFYAKDGVLYVDKGSDGSNTIRVGDVLRGQTIVWVGPSFGFGFSPWAGALNLSFVFGQSGSSLNDNVKVQPIKGKLIDATCSFTKDRAWFFTASQEGADIINRCTVIRRDGTVEATAQAVQGDGSWLTRIRGGAATGNVMLMPSDDGVVQAKIDGASIVEAERFPDTEPFLDSDSKLLVAADGLYAVHTDKIIKLAIARK
jgi:hypothetical protein